MRKRLSKITGIPQGKIPSGYQVVGTVLLLKFIGKLPPEKKRKLAEAFMAVVPNIKTVCEIKMIKGEYRMPDVTILAGSNETITVHKENDILYKLDTREIMFSKGNLSERKRLIPMVKAGETIVDMFAGIGYFSLNLAKYTKAREILAMEKNPVAYRFLSDNIHMNKLHNVNAIQGDCMLAAVSFKNHADRIIMGYFPGTEKFLAPALYMAKNGCVIHYHNIYKTKDLWKKPLKEIEDACKHYNIGFEVIAKKKVKSYAPFVWHVVIDFKVARP